MSEPIAAQEAIAETLALHGGHTSDDEVWMCRCGHRLRGSMTVVEDQLAHVAAAVVEAVRALPTEQAAALIGATAETREAENGSASSWTDRDGNRGGHSTSPTQSTRYVTPWVVTREAQTYRWGTRADDAPSFLTDESEKKP